MSTHNHTPGPWKAVRNPMRADGWFVVRDVPQQAYVGVSAFGGEPMMMQPPAVIPCQVPHADAVLIAAAPDMLAALRAVMSVADRKTAEFDMARAAIARAAGGAA